MAEAELGCERCLDELEASLKARPAACLLAALWGEGGGGGVGAARVAML